MCMRGPTRQLRAGSHAKSEGHCNLSTKRMTGNGKPKPLRSVYESLRIGIVVLQSS